MSRFLSESLQADEPHFRTMLARLERAHGNPSHDVRMGAEVNAAARNKLLGLGLDPADTTPRELYQALLQRIRQDEVRLTRRLRTIAATHISLEADVMAGMAFALSDLPLNRSVYALKPSSAKALLKKQPPKKAMKALGYRSLDSMLKHEPMASILAAVRLAEPACYKKLVERYKTLTPSDFETRPISVQYASEKRWQKLARQVTDDHKHTVVRLPELGAIVLLPLPGHAPVGAVIAGMVLALQACNEIHAATTYLKLCQVRPDFGQIVQTVSVGEPHLQARFADKAVPWQIIQRYYARLRHFDEERFGPHVQASDLGWHPVERSLALIEPSLHFWQESQHLAVLSERTPVSLNVIDAALNLCNGLPFERRIAHHFKTSLWHELSLRYLKHDTVEQAVHRELQLALAYATD